VRGTPYRDPALPRQRRHRKLDPWRLALLFAWVCDAWRIADGVVNHRGVGGEIGFAGLLGVITVVVLIVDLRARRR
jgi:hypothetical protein